LALGRTDLRRGIDGLAGIVQEQFQLDPFSKALYLFCGRRKDRIKGILWEECGFLLVYFRLEEGKFQWPQNSDEALKLTPQQYRWLMEGLQIDQPKAHKPVDTEGMVKPFVIDRKNFLFANTPNGAESSAITFSIIETAKENKLDPYRYLTYIFRTAPMLDRTKPDWTAPLMPENAPDYCKTHIGPED